MSIVETAPLTLPLDAPDASVALVGGKGASLARMAAAGLPVPPGFLLTTEAYRRFVQANDLQPAIEAASGAASDDPAGLDRASAAIASLFQGGAMPAAIDAALRRAYAALGGEPAVAARSSATAEDLPEFSFAGQQETVLNVRGDAALVAATRRCWESLWTARAIGYRRRMEIDQRTVAMGVVVQTMLAPSVAGVVFTANPATGDRGELLVNASYGLGEAIVSGQVTPDSYVLERAGLGVQERAVGEKAIEIVATGGQGTTSEAVSPERRRRPALSDEQLRRLGELAIEVETLFGGAPQDIEWALADGTFWVLQARPITNLPPAPLAEARWEPPTPGTAWIRRQVVEHMPGPLSPLFAELYLEEGVERSVDALFAAMGISGAFLEMMERPFLATVNGYAYMRASYKLRWEHVPGLLRYTASAIAMLFGSAIPLWRDQTLPAYLATIARWRTLDPATTTDEELLASVRELAWADAAYWWSTALVVGAAKISDAVLDRFLALALPGRGLSSAMFLRGFP
ncbi:MAG TPA: PEP/pyruvate-binding domain-containing protein, partial [Thermomicrobiales bacterium]|nr:PEP/pyruvate-binding domain-containing protein [Thermomicrobiales bacterium]